MNARITIELPEKTKAALDDAIREDGVSLNKFVVTALEDYLFVRSFRNLREEMITESEGTYTDKDIFDLVS